MSTKGAKPHTRFNENMALYKTKTLIATTNLLTAISFPKNRILDSAKIFRGYT